MPCKFTSTYMIDLTVGDREENINDTLGEKSDEITIVQNLYTFKTPELFLLSFGFVVR